MDRTLKGLIDGYTPRAKSQNIDVDKIKRMLPKNCHHTVSQELVDTINNIQRDTDGYLEQFNSEEAVLSHMGVLNEVRVSLPQYVDAVKFVMLTRNGHMTNGQAYEIVFPHKMKELAERGSPLSTSWSSEYNSNPLVVKIRARMHVGVSLTHASMEGQAMNKLYQLMNGETGVTGVKMSATTMLEAAKGILAHLKEDKPDTLVIGVGQSTEAKNANMKLAENIEKMISQQQAFFKEGVDVAQLQKIHIEEAEVIELKEEND